MQKVLESTLDRNYTKQALFCKWQTGVDVPGFVDHMKPMFYGASGPSESCACEAGYSGQFRLCFKGSRSVALMSFGQVLSALGGGRGGLPAENTAVTLKAARTWFRNLTKDHACLVVSSGSVR